MKLHRLSIALLFLVLAVAVAQASVLVAEAAAPAESLAVQGAALAQAGEYQAAIRTYKEAIRLSPGSSAYFDGLGLAYQRLAETSSFPSRQTQKARVQFQHALRLNPENIEALRHLIALAADPPGNCAGDPGPTEALLARLTTLDPQAGREESLRWRNRLQQAKSPEERLACTPLSLGRALLKVVPAPSRSVESTTRPAALRSTR